MIDFNSINMTEPSFEDVERALLSGDLRTAEDLNWRMMQSNYRRDTREFGGERYRYAQCFYVMDIDEQRYMHTKYCMMERMIRDLVDIGALKEMTLLRYKWWLEFEQSWIPHDAKVTLGLTFQLSQPEVRWLEVSQPLSPITREMTTREMVDKLWGIAKSAIVERFSGVTTQAEIDYFREVWR